MRETVRFLAYSNVLTAGAALSIYSGISYSYHAFNGWMAAFIGCSTWGLYLFHRLIKIRTDSALEPRLRHWLIRNYAWLSGLLVFLVLCAALMLVKLNLTAAQWFYLALFTGISCWYVLPITGKALRSFPLLKSPLVALTWSLHLFYFPLFFDEPIDGYWFEIVRWSLFFYAITIPFDTRDSEIDDQKMKTLPQLLGKKISGGIAAIILLFFGLTTIGHQAISGNEYVFWLAILLLVFTVLKFTRAKAYLLYAVFDLLMILLGISFLIN